MGKINEFLVRLYLAVKKDNRLNYLDELERSLFIDYKTVKDRQFNQLKSILNYSYRYIPFYKYWFDKHGVRIDDIHSFSDYALMVPILKKSDILPNINLFTNSLPKKKRRYIAQTTGGSTGETLKFRMSFNDHQLGTALLLRGMGYGGYKLGDKILILAGGSLVNKNPSISTLLLNRIFNQYKVSSYGLSDGELKKVSNLIIKEKINFLRGYASAIFLFAEFCRSHQISIKLKSVFSTSERLLPLQRTVIEQTFSCKVYNNYGLNDGGVSAFEFGDDRSLMVDMERGYLEIDNPQFIMSRNCEGKILATSLQNTEFPFIRYDTGDIGTITFNHLNGTPERPCLTDILGRETEFLIINEKKISSPVLTVLMGKTNVEQYSIIQKNETTVEIKIKKGEGYSFKDEEFIKKSLIDKCGNFNLIFTMVENFNNKNKHKFIFREF